MGLSQVAWPVSLGFGGAAVANSLAGSRNETHLSIKAESKVQLYTESDSSPVFGLRTSSVAERTHSSVQSPWVHVDLDTSLLGQAVPVQVYVDIVVVPQDLLHLLLILFGDLEGSPARLLPFGVIALGRGDTQRGVTLRARQVKVPEDG
ncbi:hypothetical protein HG531_006789 [Fusarium graminearum]|nr:hypothetical protein HG531_006789 [Fusarium graminearum]